MESHILNAYHQAHFRPIGHKILRMKNDSLSSESSYNQSCPEYPQISVPQSRLSVDSNTVDWDQIQTINITLTSQDTSRDYKSFGLEECMEDLEQNRLQEHVEDSGEELEKAICRQEVHFDYNDDEIIEFDDYRDVMHSKSHHNTQMTESNNTEDNSLVEGRDYDVIIVYPINPNLVDISSDDDIETIDYSIDQHDLEAEYINGDDRSYLEVNHEDQNTISRDDLDIDLDSPLLFNIDEYLVDNNNNEHLLNTNDSVIKDVDKYFIKDNGKENTLYNNFFMKHKLPEKQITQFHIPVSTPNIEECLISDVNKDVVEENTKIDNETDNCQVIDQDNTYNPDISINEADLEDLPDFEGLKDYLSEDMTYTKFSHIQTSCLCPQSPMQNICMDVDVVKTCMRMNLSDLAFDNGRNSTENASQSDEMPRTLTDKVNSDQITINNKMEPKLDPEKNNLGHKDEEIKRSKKLHSLPNLKGGQIILEPEVLPSNSRSPISRHRSCKSKQVVSHVSSDEKTVKNAKNKKDTKNKSRVKPPLQSKFHKKLSPPHREPDSFREKSNSSVIIQSDFKMSDSCSEKSTGSIKLTIKNKSKVVLHCEHIESQKYKNIDKCENNDREITKNGEKNIQELDRVNEKVENIVETITIKEKPHPKNENVYTTLLSNKQHVQIHQALQSKRENRTCDDEFDIKKEAEEPLKNEKQEYKLRKDNCSNNSSEIVSPKVPDIFNPLSNNVIKCPKKQTTPNGLLNSLDKANDEQNLLDPIKEAARILLVAKKRKDEAMRKREEDIVNNRLLKVKNLQLQPLFSDAETMKIVGMTKPEIMPVPLEKLQSSADYEKIVLVNIGTITDEKILSYVEEPVVGKKSDLVLKTDKKSPVNEKTHSSIKIDKERYKNITTTLESLRNQVVTKMLSNSLFSSIQDVIMKNAPKEAQKHDERHKPLQEKRDCRFTKSTIVREYDPKGEHGEDKVILYLDKHRRKPSFSNVAIQTDPVAEFAELPMPKEPVGPVSRKRNYSDVSLSSDESRLLESNERQLKPSKPEDRVSKPKELRLERTETKKKRSRKVAKSMTPPLRKPAVSKRSDSSSSLSSSSFSSSSSSSSTSSRRSRGSCSSYKRDKICNQKSYRRETETPVEERRIVFVGRVEKDVTKQALRNQFSKFGRVTEVRLHSKEDGYRYGFVTYQRARDAWSAVEASSTFPQYDVGFGGRRAFCRQSYADLDGLDVKYTESAYYGESVSSPIQRDDDLSFEQMLLEMKKKLGQRKSAKES